VAAHDGFGSAEWFDAWFECFAPSAARHALDGTGGASRPELYASASTILRRPWRFLHAPVNVHSPRYGWKIDGAPDLPALDRSLRAALAAARAHGVELALLAEDGATAALVRELAARGGWTLTAEACERSLVVDTDGDWETYWKGLSGKRKKVMNAEERQLRELGRVEIAEAGQTPDWCPVFEEWLALEARGWKGNNGSAIVQRPTEARFYRRVVEAAAQKGQLRLYALRLDGRLIAGQLLLADDGVLFWLKTAYDEALGRYGPGAILFRHTLQDCFADPSITAVNIAGGPPWTEIWSRRAEPLLRVRLVPTRSLAGLGLAAEAQGRRMRDRIAALRAGA
jgi:GNAT acetyltransferase-like protein